MSKKGQSKRHCPQKQVDELVQAHLGLRGDTEQPASSRKRLKKLAEVNRDEEIIEKDDTERLPSEQQSVEGEEGYRQFGLKDDEDLKREQQLIKSNKQTKSLKGNHHLDKFLQKRIQPDKKSSKETKPKPSNLQLTLEEMARIKKQKRAQRKSSDEFISNDHEPLSPQPQQQSESAARKMYQQFNGSTEDEKKLVEYAMKLSLTAASDKQSATVSNNNRQKYPIKEAEVNRKLMLSQKKDAKEKKPTEDKSKNKKVTQREGPLNGMVIAFTGEFADYEKDEVIEVCMQLGAECPKSITKKCNLLIQGAFVMDHFKRKLSTPVSETTKSREARQRNIKIVPYDQLENFFLEKTQTSLQELIDRNKVGPKNISSFDVGGIQKPTEQGKGLPKEEQKKKIERQEMEIEPVKDFRAQSRQDTRLWTEKYKPNKLQDIRGHNSQIRQLKQWLQTWDDVHLKGLNPEFKELKGQSPKAALLSGDPGIGKTTTARLLAVELNYAVSEFNASDVRNKSGINLMESKSYNLDIAKNLQKSLIIMDEVDGMSAGDRGGVAAIIQMIKAAKVPIICICNDRSSQKIRSLASHCLDVRFHKPQKGVLVKRLKQVLEEEGGSGEDRALELLVETFNNDMRQILSYLELIFKTVSPKITLSALSSRSSHSKDSAVMINHFDATRRLLNRSQFGGLTISQRTELFFIDSDLVPIMVHENLLASNRKPKMSPIQFHSFVKGLQGMVIGDMLDRMVRKEQEWGLMPSYGFMSCVYSTEKISDSLGFPQFPSWLGKNSSQRKNRRLVRQLKNSIFPTTLCSSFSGIKNHYSSLILQQLVSLLKQEDVEGAIDFMEEYGLNPGILNQHLNSLVMSTDKSSPLSAIPSQIKSKLTRLFNKRHEDARLKEHKSKKGAVQHAKFNPVLQQMEMEDEGEGEVQEEDAKEEKRKMEVKKGKKK